MFNFGPLVAVVLFGVVLLVSGLKVLREYERAVVFRVFRPHRLAMSSARARSPAH